MLGANSKADQTGRDAAQHGALAQEPKSQWRRKLSGALQYAADHPVLDEELELVAWYASGTRDVAGPRASPRRWGLRGEGAGQNVGSRNRVLNCQIYADPANRRHGMSRILDAQ